MTSFRHCERSEAIHSSPRTKVDCFVASAPLHKRFAFVAGNDGLTNQHTLTSKQNLRRIKCQSLSASLAQAPRSVRSITSSSPIRAFPVTAVSSSVSAISIRCCRAQPSDRVTRFLDAAGVVKRAARNNPEKAVPRKERKANAEAAATTASATAAAAAAAKTAAAAKK
jgi:hypothetical protein